MQFRDLNRQYLCLKDRIDASINDVLMKSEYIGGEKVRILENKLADYVGVKHCITCANGTDALMLALMALNIKSGDAVFIPDFTFFASAEMPAFLGATPVFVDINPETYNINPESLENAIKNIISEGKLNAKVIMAVDLFGMSADYNSLRNIADKYGLYIIEDGAQGFGASYYGKHTCSFGDISTTSFFPAKPLGCYGDGGAVFTDNDDYADIIQSLCIHGKGTDKYHNIRIGTNSRLDNLQAAILLEKYDAFIEYELSNVNKIAERYNNSLPDTIKKPVFLKNYYSSWAQYTICADDSVQRDKLIKELKKSDIPANIYYPVPMHMQKAFENSCVFYNSQNTNFICERVLSLPIGPYMLDEEVDFVCDKINNILKN